MKKIFVILMSVSLISLNSFAQANSGTGQWMRLPNPDKIDCATNGWHNWVEVRYMNAPIFSTASSNANADLESNRLQNQSCRQAQRQAQIDGKSVYLNTQTGYMVPEDGYFVRSK